MSEVMFFGKHKGLPVVEVSTDYLVWCATRLKKCPTPIIAELDRRGLLTGLAHTKSVRKYMQRKGGRSSIPQSTTVGSHYKRLLSDWQSCGGDESACPFDVPQEGYMYLGPTIQYALGIPYIGGADADALSERPPR